MLHCLEHLLFWFWLPFGGAFLFIFILVLSILIILIIPIILSILIILIILIILFVLIIVVINSFLLPSLSASSISFIVLVSNLINIKRLALFVTCSNSKKPRETVAAFRLHLANPPFDYHPTPALLAFVPGLKFAKALSASFQHCGLARPNCWVRPSLSSTVGHSRALVKLTQFRELLGPLGLGSAKQPTSRIGRGWATDHSTEPCVVLLHCYTGYTFTGFKNNAFASLHASLWTITDNQQPQEGNIGSCTTNFGDLRAGTVGLENRWCSEPVGLHQVLQFSSYHQSSGHGFLPLRYQKNSKEYVFFRPVLVGMIQDDSRLNTLKLLGF